MKLADPRAILAIDPTSRGLAFAYFEGGELRDWGTRHVPGNDLAAFDRILALCPADVLVIEDGKDADCLRRARVRILLRRLSARANAADLDVRSVPRSKVLHTWTVRGARNKDAIASEVAVLFPLLEIVLPRPRGKYRSEDARTGIFDAVSLAIEACGGLPDSDTLAA